jgi:hypothetical protein
MAVLVVAVALKVVVYRGLASGTCVISGDDENLALLFIVMRVRDMILNRDKG